MVHLFWCQQSQFPASVLMRSVRCVSDAVRMTNIAVETICVVRHTRSGDSGTFGKSYPRVPKLPVYDADSLNMQHNVKVKKVI